MAPYKHPMHNPFLEPALGTSTSAHTKPHHDMSTTQRQQSTNDMPLRSCLRGGVIPPVAAKPTGISKTNTLTSRINSTTMSQRLERHEQSAKQFGDHIGKIELENPWSYKAKQLRRCHDKLVAAIERRKMQAVMSRLEEMGLEMPALGKEASGNESATQGEVEDAEMLDPAPDGR